MKIGILTYHRSHNYGAFLQCYSLSRKLNAIEGIECEVINYDLDRGDKAYKIRIWKRPIYYRIFKKQDKMFDDVQKLLPLSGELLLDNGYKSILDYANQHYDVVVAGSDEIWRIASRGFPNVYWLPGKHDFIKMSYAASARNPQSLLTEEVKGKMRELYSDFEYIGARDDISIKQINEIVGNSVANRNCDPTFFYDRYGNKEMLRERLCSKWNIKRDKKIIAVFYDRPALISKLRKILGREYKFICITRPMWNADKNLCSVTPFEWADIIGGCDYMLTSYFHGMLFAVNQNTPFMAIDRRANRDNLETSKLYDFLSYSGIEDRYRIATEIDDNGWKVIGNRIRKEIVEKVAFDAVVEKQKILFQSFEMKLKELVNE